MEKVKAAKPVTSRRGGKNCGSSITETIISQFECLCTAAATNTHDLARHAASRENSSLVRLAFHLERITYELYAIGQVLPTALALVMLESEVAA